MWTINDLTVVKTDVGTLILQKKSSVLKEVDLPSSTISGSMSGIIKRRIVSSSDQRLLYRRGRVKPLLAEI